MRYKKKGGVAPGSGKTQWNSIRQNQNREVGRGGWEDREREGGLRDFRGGGARKGEIIWNVNKLYRIKKNCTVKKNSIFFHKSSRLGVCSLSWLFTSTPFSNELQSIALWTKEWTETKKKSSVMTQDQGKTNQNQTRQITTEDSGVWV